MTRFLFDHQTNRTNQTNRTHRTQCKDEGTKLNKWLLVNVQNSKEFACQVLNRDVWSNQTVKDIIKEHFIFWQIYHEQAEGQRYIQFYNVHEYPHVSILDPRTGEKLSSFSVGDADSLCEFITEFINEHPTPNGKQNHASQTPSSSSGPSSSHRDSLSKVGGALSPVGSRLEYPLFASHYSCESLLLNSENL